MMKYLVIGSNNVAFCENVQEVGQAIINSHSPDCKIYTADTYHDLLDQARMLQLNRFHQSTDPNAPYQMLSLPSIITKPTFLRRQQSALYTNDKQQSKFNLIKERNDYIDSNEF